MIYFYLKTFKFESKHDISLLGTKNNVKLILLSVCFL
jgi:hypothetical protein